MPDSTADTRPLTLKALGRKADEPFVEASGNRTDSRRRATARFRAGRGGTRRLGLALVVMLGALPLVVAEESASGAPTLAVEGLVFRDDNGNGLRDPLEFGLPKIPVAIVAANGTTWTGETGANGRYSVLADPNLGPHYRVEIRASLTSYTGAPAGGSNATTVQFLDTTGSTTNPFPARDVALVDGRFFGTQAMTCYSTLLTSSGDDSVHMYAAPGAGGAGTPLFPPANQGGAQAWIRTQSGGLEEPAGITFGPDGDVWVGSQDKEEVFRYDGNTGAFKDSIKISGMKDPYGVTFGLDGLLYITDHDQRKIFRYNPVTDAANTFSNPSEFNLGGGLNLDPQQGIVFGTDGFLYVSAGTTDTTPGRVMQFNATTGKYTGMSWTLDAIPRGLEIGPDNLPYAATGSATVGGVWRIDPIANTATKLITSPKSADVSFGPDNTLFLVDALTGKVKHYSWPALSPLSDYALATGTGGYTQSAPRALMWWRGTNACPTMQVPVDLGNRVWSDVDADGRQDPGEPGLSAVSVSIVAPNDTIVATTETNNAGEWSWPQASSELQPGATYQLQFTGPITEAATPTSVDVAGDAWADLRDSDVTATNGDLTIDFVMDATGSSPPMHSLDAGLTLPPGSIGGLLFADEDNNGTKAVSEAVLPYLSVELWDSAGSQRWASVQTNRLGSYTVPGLPSGDYIARVPSTATGTTYRSSSGTHGSLTGPFEPAPDPDDDKTPFDDGSVTAAGNTDTKPVTLTLGTEPTNDGDDGFGNRTVDFGFYTNATVGDRVWSDDNRNGKQDAGEGTPLLPVMVELRNAANAVLRTTNSAADGSYRFDNVNAGTYNLHFVIPSAYGVTGKDVGGDDTLDNDADSAGVTANFTVNSGVPSDLTRDLGLQGGSIGNLVFDDTNNNGVRDATEVGMGGIGVLLMDEAGTTQIATVNTSGDGSFRFNGLPNGTYRVRIPFLALYSGAAVGYVSSVGAVAESGTVSYEPAADPDNDTDNDDSGSADWTSGDVTSLPVTLTLGTEPTADDSDNNTNLTTDLGLHKPEGVFTGGGYYGTMTDDKPIGYWRLGEKGSTVATDSSGNNKHGSYSGKYFQGVEGALIGDPDTAASFTGATGEVNIDNLAVSTAAGAKTTVEFFMYWDGVAGGMPFGFNTYDLWFNGTRFGFNSGCSDNWGINSTALRNRWVHVVAVFTNAGTAQNKLYINGVQQTLSGSIRCNGSATSSVGISSWRGSSGYYMRGRVDEVSVYNGELSSARVSAHWLASGRAASVLPKIATVAGNGSTTDGAPGGQASGTGVRTPYGVTVAPDGTIYVSNPTYLLRVRTDGVLERVAKLDSSAWSNLVVGPDGNIYVSEYTRCRIRKVTPSGVVTNWAGDGVCSTTGDGGPIGSARVNRPTGIAFDTAGNAYFAEYSGSRVRKVTPGGVVSTLATGLSSPWAVTLDPSGNLYVGEWTGSKRVAKITPAGVISTLITDSLTPLGVVYFAGKVYYSTYNGCQVKVVAVDTTVVGGIQSSCAFSGDGGAAVDAQLRNPTGIAIGPDGAIYVADLSNSRVRKVK